LEPLPTHRQLALGGDTHETHTNDINHLSPGAVFNHQ